MMMGDGTVTAPIIPTSEEKKQLTPELWEDSAEKKVAETKLME